jgi:hypothetical protein
MAISAVRWLLRRLSTLILPLPHRALALPPEIILIIVTYLDNPSTIALSLTCQNLHALCFSRALHLNAQEKEYLLLSLERDVPNLYFCHRCTKLHPWYPRWGYAHHKYYKTLPCQHHHDKGLMLLPHLWWFSYHHARLFVNRHLYGPAHGLSLDRLDHNSRIHLLEPYKTKVVYSESLQARILDDRLLLSATTTMSNAKGEVRSLRDYVDEQGDLICPHLTMSRRRGKYVPVQLPELNVERVTEVGRLEGVADPSSVDKSNRLGYFAPCRKSLGSCSVCLTDYDINITWNDGKSAFIITISTYHDLGQCRSPYDWSWRALTTRNRIGTSRRAHEQDCGVGVVRDRWNKVDRGNDRGLGQWVDMPRLLDTAESK